MPVKVTEEQRGPSVQLLFSFIGASEEGEESEEYVINNLAVVKTKLTHTDNDVFYYNCYFKFMKLNEDKNITIEMNLSSEKPPYKKQLICTDDWSEWEHIGEGDLETGLIFDREDYETIYDLKLNISVRMIEKPRLCAKMYLDADFTDFSLSAINGVVAVHKIVMASHSDVFKAMLNGEWKETVEGQVTLKGTTRETLQHLKDYMYLDILPDEGLCPLLLIAMRYLIEDLKQRCIAKLTDNLTSENLYKLLDFACENNIPELAYEILHLTPSIIIHSAYENSKKNKFLLPKSADEK